MRITRRLQRQRPRNVEKFLAAEARTTAWLLENGGDLVGLTEEDLTTRADAAQIHVRVISRDEHGFWLAADRSPNRINVELVDGRVSRIDGSY